MNTFMLESEFSPKGDQQQAIDALTEGVNAGKRHQVLLGVTGSGKTFTMANVIAKIQKPTLVVVHNKTLAAQLYQEFKSFFRTMPWSTSSVITIITSPKPIFPPRTPISPRTPRSTIPSIRCGMRPRRPCWSATIF